MIPRMTPNGMPAIRSVSLVLAHVPSLVRLGSKPLRALREVKDPVEYLRPHLRDWDAARTYAPNQVFIGNLGVDDLAARLVPWHRHPVAGAGRFGPDGEIMPEDEFLGLLATCDGFDLLALAGEIADRARQQVEAVARREEAEEFVRGHDSAVRTEPPRARNRMTVPRHQPRREIVHAQVADEHLVRRVRARSVPVTQVRPQVLDRILHLAQRSERLRAESDEAGHVREDEGDRADRRHSVRCHPRDHTFWAALNAR